MRALLLLALAGCSLARAEGDADKIAAGKTAFGVVYRVLEHPRCKNCHPAGDAPLQFFDGRPHAMNITRRSEKNGLPCSVCHRAKNNPRPDQPPGAPNWHLPPAETPMIFEGRTPKQLCEQLKDPKQTGGKDLPGLVEHVAHDPLVGWGWAPGADRTPVPGTQAELGARFHAWIESGAVCP